MRYAVITDIHGNLTALDAVLADFRDDAVSEVWCLGDILGYGPDPNGCVERLRQLPRNRCLVGNHDWAVLGKLDISDFNTDARQAVLWTREQLTRQNWEYLDKLPARLGPVAEEFTLAHASPRYSIWEYVLSPATAALNFDYFDTPYCFIGHTHVPIIYRQLRDRDVVEMIKPEPDTPFPLGQDRLIINPGGVGQPRDGDPRASYTLLDTEERTIEFRRVLYDVEEVQERMIKASMPPRLIARLSYGL